MKKTLFAFLFLAACQTQPQEKPQQASTEANQASPTAKNYLEILEDSLSQSSEKANQALPFFVSSENWEANYLIYENKAVEGQFQGILAVWQDNPTDWVMRIENSLIAGGATQLLKLYRFEANQYQEQPTQSIVEAIKKSAAEKTEPIAKENANDSFGVSWVITLPDKPQKPLVLEVQAVCVWSDRGEHKEVSISIGNILYEQGKVVFKEK